MKKFLINAKIWRYPGLGGWHFVYVGDKKSKKLRDLPRAKKTGFNSIKVRCKLGKTTWDTSLFPSKQGPYLLAVKASVRNKEGVGDGDLVKIDCRLIQAPLNPIT